MSDLKALLGKDYTDTKLYAKEIQRYGLSKMPPLIITCAITGSNQGKEANPNLPETKEEQVQQAYDAYNAGAAMVHIHCRDEKNTAATSYVPADYLAVNTMIREKCPDLIINNTCTGVHLVDMNRNFISPQMTFSVPAKPEVSSIDITCAAVTQVLKARPGVEGREKDIVNNLATVISPDDCQKITRMMEDADIKPEWEVFSLEDLKLLNAMIDQGITKQEVHWIQALFGGFGSYPTIDNMIHISRMLPENAMMSVIGIGAAQNAMMTAGILMGHHIRVGLEDNIYYGPGELAKSNAQLVERAVMIARALGREIATPAQAREMMGLSAQPRQYK